MSTVIHKSSSLSYTIQYSPLDESNSIDKQTQKQDAKQNFSYQANEWPFLPFLMSYFSANWRRNKLTVARLFDSGPRSYEKQRANQRCHIETFSFAPLFKNRYDLRIIIAPASSSLSKNPRIKKKSQHTCEYKKSRPYSNNSQGVLWWTIPEILLFFSLSFFVALKMYVFFFLISFHTQMRKLEPVCILSHQRLPHPPFRRGLENRRKRDVFYVWESFQSFFFLVF